MCHHPSPLNANGSSTLFVPGTRSYLSARVFLIVCTKILIAVGVDSLIHMNHNRMMCSFTFISYIQKIACNIYMQPWSRTFDIIYYVCAKIEFDIYMEILNPSDLRAYNPLLMET